MLSRAATRAVRQIPAGARPPRGLRAGSTVVLPAKRPEPSSQKASRPRDLQTIAARSEGLDHAAHAALKAKRTAEAAPAVAVAKEAASGPSRSHFEDWMVNLRGEDRWLAKDRDLDWYTGKPPLRGQCPGVDDDGCIRSLPMPNLGSITRKGAQEYFDNSWTLVETLFAGFKGEEPFYRPPVHGLRHPQIFYYGHTPCLYVNKLRVAGILDGPVNEYFESIFEVGVDEMLWDDMHKNDMVWPTVAEVQQYRKQVYKTVSDIIATHPALEDGTKVTWDHPMWALFMSFEHERIHLETSSVLFRETPIELMQVPAGWPAPHPSVGRPFSARVDPQEGADYPANRMLPVAGATVELGKPRDHPAYGFDNEYGSRTVQVPDFRASEHMVTNGEFWHFVQSGGYRTQRYWSEDGWGWRKYRNMKWPFFWETDGPEGSMRFKLRTIFEIQDMQWDWPVDVNYHEAKAYCAWKSERDGLEGKPEAYRVITEAEHGLIRPAAAQLDAARAEPLADRAMWASGQRFALAAEPGAANLNHAYGTQSPVDSLPASPTGHRDAMGNAWEWTEDHFNPLPGFEVHRVYDDFSAPCFDGRHHMIMGGSFMSSGAAGGSAFCRYHFRPHFLQHSGFRLVSSAHAAPATLLDEDGKILAGEALPGSAAPAGLSAGEAVYETRELLDQYLGLHFPASGLEEEHGPVADHCASALAHAQRFPQRVAQLLVAMRPARTNGRALDLGCAVGGASFELAAAGSFEEVVGIDFSQSFVDAARQMRDGQEIRFRIPSEGDLGSEVRAVHEPHVDAVARARTAFQTGDACRLSAQELGTFDGAVLANLLCRLPEPLACLDGLRAVLNPGGVVVIVTPFSWLEQWTPRSRWLGGYRDESSGRDVHSKERLAEEMVLRGFEKVHEEQMPLVIREHRRKYQYIVSEATAWRKL